MILPKHKQEKNECQSTTYHQGHIMNNKQIIISYCITLHCWVSWPVMVFMPDSHFKIKTVALGRADYWCLLWWRLRLKIVGERRGKQSNNMHWVTQWSMGAVVYKWCPNTAYSMDRSEFSSFKVANLSYRSNSLVFY